MTMSWKMEVQTDSTGKWYTNALVFATAQEAENYAVDLAFRWTLVREWRTSEVTDEVNYSFINGELVDVARSGLERFTSK